MDDELLQEFINESREHLASIEADLLTIEENAADIDEELVNKVFRAAHSIKGGSSFFGLKNVKELAHRAETVLDMLRERQMAPNSEIINVLLAAFDQLRKMINNPGQSEKMNISELVAGLIDLASGNLADEQKKSLNQHVAFARKGDKPSVTFPKVDFDRALRANQHIYCVDYDLIHDIEAQGKTVLDVFRELRETGEILDCVLDFEAVGTLHGPVGNQLPLRLVFATILRPDDVDVVLPAQEKIEVLFDPGDKTTFPSISGSPSPAVGKNESPYTEEETSARTPKSEPTPPEPIVKAQPKVWTTHKEPAAIQDTVEETLRINVTALESLMNLTGELVLSRNQLHTAIANQDERSLVVSEQRINQVTSELQDAVMQTRLQPIGNVFAKFPRVVRDIAIVQQKQIRVDIKGKDVALDKSLIEGLSDPLTHMVRNAADHGIELPAARSRTGKVEQGTIRIEARHEAGHVVVEIADDGKGIDPEKISRAALNKGLITEESLGTMSDSDKTALVFLPGLSTADQVTDISGRGVGMDVVKTNLDQIGGKVEIDSQPGKGTCFTIKLPLTLAIIPSLIASVESEYFAIPQINIDELLRVRAEEVQERIEVIGDVEVLVLRERLLPLMRFTDLLGVVPTYVDPTTGRREIDRRENLADRRSPRHSLKPHDTDSNEDIQNPVVQKTQQPRDPNGRRLSDESAMEIAVVNGGTIQYALVFDHFHNTEEIVVKPLGPHIKGLNEYAGATILGDGTVALILDVSGLASKANLRPISGTARAREQAERIERERFDDHYALLLFQNAPGEHCATPLDTVQRIEQIAPNQVETTGNRRTMQYRGGILPLVTLSDVAEVGVLDDVKEMVVIVFNIHGREVGLLGTMPVSVIESRVAIDQVAHRQTGISGSAIIKDRTTLIVDVFELVDTAYLEWKSAHALDSEEQVGPTVLLAEDSDFFRTQIKRFLEEDGYTVLDAPDGEAAWDLLQKHLKAVRAVVTDIEMPRLNGLDLTRRIRADNLTASLPVIALTTLAGEDDVARGLDAGINDYQIKLDRDRLLDRMRDCVAGM